MSIWDCDKPLDAMMLSHDHIAMLAVKHEKEIQELKRLVTPMMEFKREQPTAKCAVKDCENHTHQGKFIGLLCSPCHKFVSGDGGLYSQAYRNSRAMIDTAVEMERALAKQPTKICGPNLVGVLNAAGNL